MEQKWLSMTGICNVLGISTHMAGRMVKQKYLVRWGKGNATRYLDPTPEYKEQLRLGQLLHGKDAGIPRDFDLTALLTIRELAEIMGWKFRYAQNYIVRNKVPFVRAGKFRLLRLETVRNILWKRSDRKGAVKQLAPFLLRDLIAYFLKRHAAQSAEVPTDTEFAEDDLLRRKLERMLRYPSPQKELAVKEFMEKVELAKSVVTLVKASASPESAQ